MTMNSENNLLEAKTEGIIVAPRVRQLQVWLLVLFAPLALYMSGAIVILLLALAATCLCDKKSRSASYNRNQPGYHHWLLLLLLVYSFVSVYWARNPGESFYDWWRMTLLISSGWLLSGYLVRLPVQHGRLLLQAALLGVVLLVLLLAMEWLSGGAVAAWIKRQYTGSLLFTSRASAVLAVIIWPVALYCYKRLGCVAAGVLIVASFTLLSVLPLFAAVVAAVMAGLVFVGSLLWPRVTPVVMGTMFAAAVLLAPLLAANLSGYARPGALQPMLQTLPSSWAHRLVIWDFFSGRISDSPWLGHGLGTAHGLGNMPKALAAYKRVSAPLGNTAITASMPLHPS